MNEEANIRSGSSSASVGRSGRGLRFVIITNIAVVMLTVITLTFLIIFQITSTTLAHVEIRRAEDTMRSLQVSVSRLFAERKAMTTKAEVELNMILKTLISQLDLESVVVVDGLGRVVMRLPPEGPVTLGGGEPDLRRAMGGREMVTTERRRGFDFFTSAIKELAVSAPIVAGGEIKGGIKARFSMARLDRSIKITQQILIGFIIATTLIMLIFGAFLLSKTVIKPLEQLMTATRDFAEGDWDKRVEVEGEKEIAQLANAFNEMAERIQNNRVQLEENVKALRQINRDLERTRAELIYSEKLAGVGMLAQGVAHEIGNPLSSVLGYLELMERTPQLSEKVRDYIERSERELARVNVIIRELLDYSRPTKPARKPVEVDEVVSALLTLVTGQKRFRGIKFNRKVEPNLPNVMADRNQLLQVMVNLAFNAADVMPEEGVLEIGAALGKWAEPTEAIYAVGNISHDIPPDTSAVKLWIRDTGAGISPGNITKIFDPFFTTKEPGQGTGLGLAICVRIIEGFGAKLTVQSTLGEGSTFTIVFPLEDT